MPEGIRAADLVADLLEVMQVYPSAYNAAVLASQQRRAQSLYCATKRHGRQCLTVDTGTVDLGLSQQLMN